MNALADWRFWTMAAMLSVSYAYLVWYFKPWRPRGRRE